MAVGRRQDATAEGNGGRGQALQTPASRALRSAHTSSGGCISTAQMFRVASAPSEVHVEDGARSRVSADRRTQSGQAALTNLLRRQLADHLSLRSLEVYIATTANCQAQSLHLGVAKPRQGGDRGWLVLARDIIDSVRACSQPRVAAALVIEPERGLDSWLGCCRCCSRLSVSAAETSLLTTQRIWRSVRRARCSTGRSRIGRACSSKGGDPWKTARSLVVTSSR